MTKLFSNNPLALVAGAIIAFGVCTPAWAAVQIGGSSTPQQSTNGVFPSSNGNSTVYTYTVANGGSVSDSIPVSVCITGEANAEWTSFQVQLGPIGNGGDLPGITLSPNLTFSSGETVPISNLPVCKTAMIQISTGALTLVDPAKSQVFVKNVNISDVNPAPGGSNQPNVNWSGSTEIHIRVLVRSITSNISCFITDSSGNFLTKCDGSLADQSGSDAGRFAIVANKRNTEVSTNPGQFYYNMLYYNPGSTDMQVNVGFSKWGVNAHGTQAIHAALFAPPFSGITQDGFDAVNEGIPGGANDAMGPITIPAGWTLWVDYHLDWNGLGSTVPNACATECPSADQQFWVLGTVTVTGGSTETCTAGAWGYKK